VQTFQFTRETLWYQEMAFSPDGRWLALNGKPFTLLDTTGKQEPKELPLGDFRWAFAFARGGEAIAYLPDASMLTEYDLATGRERTGRVEKGYACGMAADRYGETLYLAVGPYLHGGASTIRVVGVSDLKPRASFGKVTDDLRGLLISANGTRLACHGRQHIRVWDITDGKRPQRAAIEVMPKGGLSDFDLTRDGELLAVADSYALSLWDTTSGKRVAHSGQHRRAVTAVACSPKQPLLITGDSAGNVFLWDTAGRVVKRYDWGLAEVRTLTFDHDGLRAAAADLTGKIVIWDVDG
jgi:WD40 repeat protein